MNHVIHFVCRPWKGKISMSTGLTISLCALSLCASSNAQIKPTFNVSHKGIAESKRGLAFKAQVVRTQTTYASAITAVVTWMSDLQYKTDATLPSYGAIKLDNVIGAHVGGVPYYRVSPYFANNGVLGMLRTHRPGAVSFAKLWINWFFNHLRAKDTAMTEVPYQHWYQADGSSESACIVPDGVTGDASSYCHYNDATDSAISTFFSVLWAAYQQIGHENGEDFLTPQQKTLVEKLATTLMTLRHTDGLFWAKTDYPIKYLEDQCEVFDGLMALSHLEQTAFHDSAKAAQYKEHAENLRQAILKELYDPATKLYIPSKDNAGMLHRADLKKWYPDSQAQAWPHLFSIVAPDDPKTVFAMDAINQHWAWDTRPETINDGFINASHAYAALLTGDTRRVQTYLLAVKQLKFPPAHDFPQPFTIADAGWLLASLTRLAPPPQLPSRM